MFNEKELKKEIAELRGQVRDIKQTVEDNFKINEAQLQQLRWEVKNPPLYEPKTTVGGIVILSVK